MKETAMPAAPPLRIPFDAFLKRYGRTRATGHRWRRLLPWLEVQNIFGRLYISLASVQRFEEMASRGELAVQWRLPQPPRRKGRPLRHKEPNAARKAQG